MAAGVYYDTTTGVSPHYSETTSLLSAQNESDKDEPSKAEKSKINPLIREPSDAFLMGDKEIKFNPLKDIDDLVPIPRNEESDESETETIMEEVSVFARRIPYDREDYRACFQSSNTRSLINCMIISREILHFNISFTEAELEECLALADLGASINLMPLSIWKKLILPELKPTRMTLELANRSVAYPVGIAKNVFVQVGKFMFPADFVVIDYDVDPRVPLILGRPFLRTARTLVDVYGEELTLRVGDEKLVFNVENTLIYPHKHGDESINQIDIIDTTCKDHFHEVLNVQKSIHPLSGSPTPSTHVVASFTPFGDSDFLLEETDVFLAFDDSIPPGIDNGIYDLEGDILFLKKLLNDEPSKDLPPKELK
ncbi:reverse transcriptase domain-containing protein [Tanacetum coccineum]